MRTFEDYLIEQIGLTYDQCYKIKVKRDTIKEFFHEWCYEYCVDTHTMLITIEIMENYGIFL